MNEYRGLEGEWHDLFWAEEEVNELSLLDSFLSEIEGPSLYLGSGSGRLLGPLSEKGYSLLGVEASEEMVSLSQKKWPETQVVASHWEDFELEQSYAAIVVPAFTFQLLDKPQAALEKMRTAVGEDGHLYLSLFFPWIELSGELPQGKWYPDQELTLPEGKIGKMWTRHKVDERKATLKREHRYQLLDASGEVKREEMTRQTIRWFADGALERMLSRSGWQIEKEIQNFGTPLEEGEDDLVYVITIHCRAVTPSGGGKK